MRTVLVDTDIAIDYLRGLPYASALLLSLWEEGTAYLSILSLYELYAGMKESEEEATENFIKACNVEPVIIETTQKAGELYRRYRGKGITLTSIDCLIGATALLRGHKVATRNKNHYPEKGILFHFSELGDN